MHVMPSFVYLQLIDERQQANLRNSGAHQSGADDHHIFHVAAVDAIVVVIFDHFHSFKQQQFECKMCLIMFKGQEIADRFCAVRIAFTAYNITIS